jgi:hypothetical protein
VWVVRGRITKAFSDRVRPLMNQMSPDKEIVLFGLLDAQEARPRPSDSPTWTNAYRSAYENERGDTAARESKTCERCGYALFCPSLPEP